ncbi:MAG: NusG domain II-containing protein [Clostridiales bacterium]|nr:NusG domain II-containing protein [Clostridiales bacterium]
MKKADLLLLAGILLISGLALVFVLGGSPGAQVKIVGAQGKILGVYALNEDRTIEIDEGGCMNIIVISGGQAQMSHANCPNQLCLRQKPIGKTGQSIVCLPNKLLLMIEGGDPSGLDGIT